MNPLLWLNAVVEPLFLCGAWLLKDHEWLAFLLILGFLSIPAYTLWEFRYFARRDPQRLQSEDYLLSQQRLMIQSKSVRDPIDAAAVPAGVNPEQSGSQTGSTVQVSPACRTPSSGRRKQETGYE